MHASVSIIKARWKVFFIIAALTGLTACSPLTPLNALTPGATSNKTTGLSYGPHPRQKLDIYSPKNPNNSAPVVVFFYGGNWNSGDRADYAFVGETLAANGIVTVVADYRLYPQVHYPEILQDTARATSWALREVARYGGDPKHLFVMGHSAGAYNAAMIALDKRWLAEHGMTPAALRGWIGLAGPYNFLPIQDPDICPIFFCPDAPPASQPINHVRPDASPALLIAPQNDHVVNPVRNTGQLAQKLRKENIQVTEKYFGGVGHALLIATLSRPLRGLAPTLDSITNFVASNSGKASDTIAASDQPSN